MIMMNDTTATEKQKKFATYLANRMCVVLPKKDTKEAYSKFIDKWKPAVEAEDRAMNEPDSWQLNYM